MIRLTRNFRDGDNTLTIWRFAEIATFTVCKTAYWLVILADIAKRTRIHFSSASEMAILLLVWSLTFLLWSLQLISRQWFVGIFFCVLIPAAALKAFSDYRRKNN